jgi:hypothetical protein
MIIDCTPRTSVDLLKNESDPEQFVDGTGAHGKMVNPIVKVGPRFSTHALGDRVGELIAIQK